VAPKRRRPEIESSRAPTCAPASAQTRDADYRNGNGPAATRPQSRLSSNSNPIWIVGQALSSADGHPAEVTQEERIYAATIRETAEREAAAITKQATSQAAAIREAAEREAAELRARLDWMSGELGRLAAYFTESVASSALRATAPALPNDGSALSVARSAEPATTPAKPDSKPDTRPEKSRTAGRSVRGRRRPGSRSSDPGSSRPCAVREDRRNARGRCARHRLVQLECRERIAYRAYRRRSRVDRLNGAGPERGNPLCVQPWRNPRAGHQAIARSLGPELAALPPDDLLP
jgi:hypothetical protein